MTKKEAIEVIKTTMPYMWKETKEAIQTLIPEFAESDDEMIRKEIIDFLTDGIWNTIVIDNVRQSQRYAKWIAYLEKQKEQTPIFRVGDTIIAKDGTGIPQEAFYIERIEDGFYWEKDNSILISNQDEFQLIEQNPPVCSEDIRNWKNIAYYVLKEWNGIGQYMDNPELDKIAKELQKRYGSVNYIGTSNGRLDVCYNSEKYGLCNKTEWSEEDEKHTNSILERLDGMCKKGATFTQTRFAVSEDEDWLKSLTERFNPQPKQECSEEDEDERIRKELISFVNKYYGEETKKEVLAYLEKQKEMKPAEWIAEQKERIRQNGRLDVCYNPEKYGLCNKIEWSEEDKDIINEVASILINDENRADNKVEEDRLAYLAEKIQSLCPQYHWNPSEEQMKALEEAMDRNDKIGYILRTLHDDIKKYKNDDIR